MCHHGLWIWHLAWRGISNLQAENPAWPGLAWQAHLTNRGNVHTSVAQPMSSLRQWGFSAAFRQASLETGFSGTLCLLLPPEPFSYFKPFPMSLITLLSVSQPIINDMALLLSMASFSYLSCDSSLAALPSKLAAAHFLGGGISAFFLSYYFFSIIDNNNLLSL